MERIEVKVKSLAKFLTHLKYTLSRKDSNHIINLVEKSRKDFSNSRLCRVIYFCMTLCTILDLIIIGFPPKDTYFVMQISILAISTALFILHHIFLWRYYSKQIRKEENYSLYCFIHLASGDARLELFCLIWGWCFLFYYPGIAALRCFRVIRVISFFPDNPRTKDKNYNPSQHWFNPAVGAQLLLRYLKKLAIELFWPEKSRGGLIILFMFFYTTYLFSLTFWKDVGSLKSTRDEYHCDSMRGCFLVLLRLAFYESLGLDYLYSLYTVKTFAKGGGGYTMLLTLYLIFNSMVLLNALIGIFGHAFIQDEDEIKVSNVLPKQASRKKLTHDIKFQLRVISLAIERLEAMDNETENETEKEIEEEHKQNKIEKVDLVVDNNIKKSLQSDPLQSNHPLQSAPELISEFKVIKYKPKYDLLSKSSKLSLSYFFTKPSIHVIRVAKITRSCWILFKIYLCITCLVTISEPIIVGFMDESWTAEYVILTIATILVSVDHLFILMAYPDKEVPLIRKIYELHGGEEIFEIFCILWGWIFLLTGYEGLAALRCLRIFRLLWYFEMYAPGEREQELNQLSVHPHLRHHIRVSSAILQAQSIQPTASTLSQKVHAAGEEVIKELYNVDIFIHRCLSVIKKCANYLRKLGSELFTAASRGGTMILVFFFLTMYIFGVVFWVDKGDIKTVNGYVCSDLYSCMFTMARLSFYDGGGFVYLNEIMFSDIDSFQNLSLSGFYSLLLILYLVFTSTVLLNGLIGVFGRSFGDDSEQECGNAAILREIVKTSKKLKL